MAKLVTMSDYYLQDVPAGTLYLPNHDKAAKKGTKFHVHNSASISGSLVDKAALHNNSSFLGKGIKAMLDANHLPDDRLLQHWGRVFGQENIPEFASADAKGYRVVDFPTDSVPPEQLHVHPEVLYKVQSKKFIGEIDVAQAKILKEFQSPCVVKACQSYGGSDVYFVHTKEEFEKAKEKLSRIPHCEIIINEMIKNVETTHSPHFYVTKKGEVQWIGVCEQHLACAKNDDIYENKMRMNVQEELKSQLFPSCEAVGKALHREGYFGYVGVDIVVDEHNRTFVVDVNPRFNKSSGLVMSTVYMHKKYQYSFSSYRRPIEIEREIPLDEILQKIESIENGKAVIVFAFPYKKEVSCGVRVYANSEERADEIFDQITKF